MIWCIFFVLTSLNWWKGTTRSGACGLIWLNTGNTRPDITRIEWLRALSRFGGWWCMAVLDCWSVWFVLKRVYGIWNAVILWYRSFKLFNGRDVNTVHCYHHGITVTENKGGEERYIKKHIHMTDYSMNTHSKSILPHPVWQSDHYSLPVPDNLIDDDE